MHEVYDVTLQDSKVGKVEVTREGLYYRFRCKCQLPDAEIYTIVASNEKCQWNLGVCVPGANGACLDTRVAVKHIGETMGTFLAVSKEKSKQMMFIPVQPESPFAYISALQEAKFGIQGNKPGVWIRKSNI